MDGIYFNSCFYRENDKFNWQKPDKIEDIQTTKYFALKIPQSIFAHFYPIPGDGARSNSKDKPNMERVDALKLLCFDLSFHCYRSYFTVFEAEYTILNTHAQGTPYGY